jgi:hypothetical protein
MKKNLLIFIMFYSVSGFTQLNIDSLLNSSNHLRLKSSSLKTFSTENDLNRIVNILNGDVFKYFSLEKKHDTELKKKVFLESDEGIEKLNLLNEEKKNLMNSLYYIQLFDYYGKYNLQTNSMEILVKFYEYGQIFKSNANHLQVDFLVLKSNFKDIYNDKKIESYQNTYCSQTFGMKIPSEEIALKIENNTKQTTPGQGSNVKYLIFFNFINTEPTTVYHELSGRMFAENRHLVIGEIKKIIIYNHITKEIYHIIDN